MVIKKKKKKKTQNKKLPTPEREKGSGGNIPSWTCCIMV